MIVSIMQAAYLPWLGYFHRIAMSDLHIVLDHVQIDKSSKTKFANRNKIRTKEGWCWLTVPLKTKGRSDNLYLDRLEISNESHWGRKHWNALRLNYAKAPYFSQYASFFEELYQQQWSYLKDLNRVVTDFLLQAFEIQTPFRFSSEMEVEGQKDELILNLCRHVGAETYISGPFGRDYLREECFGDAGIKVRYHDYKHPTYQQLFPGFEAFMSAVDLLFNQGPGSLEALSKGQELVTR
jgi:hypothetical protein